MTVRKLVSGEIERHNSDTTAQEGRDQRRANKSAVYQPFPMLAKNADISG